MAARLEIPPELLAEGKFLYEETLTPVTEICRRMKISRSAFYTRSLIYGWVRRRYTSIAEYAASAQIAIRPAIAAPPPEIKVEAPKPAEATGAAPENPAALSVRFYDAVHKQMDAIESIQRTLRPGSEMQSERTVRILATLNKALLDIAAITRTDEATLPDAARNDPVPRDVDEFRNELARRIKGLVDAERTREGERSGESSA